MSTPRQGESGFGHLAQNAQITEFAERNGFRIESVFSETGSAVGEDSFRERRELQGALLEAERRDLPIIVADVSRLSRHSASVEQLLRERRVTIEVANLGAGANRVILSGEAARAQEEARLLSERTKNALRKRKSQGVLLGNRTNLPEAQRKGAAANARLAAVRAQKEQAAVNEAKKRGASTLGEIARFLNENGVRTASGKPWTKHNVNRVVRKERLTALPPAPVEKASIADVDGRLTPDGRARVTSAMAKRGLKLGALMKELGLPALDASFGNAIRGTTRIRDRRKITAMDAWLRAEEV